MRKGSDVSYEEYLQFQRAQLDRARSLPAKTAGECCGQTWRSEKAFAAHQRYHEVWGELERRQRDRV